MPSIQPRQYYSCPAGTYRSGNYCYDNRSGWYNYGRWVTLAGIIIIAFLLFFLFACITARRRRRAGFTPYRGTGWAAGRPPPGHGPAQYTAPQPYYGNNQQPPPTYAQNQASGQYGNNTENHGYYGGQQTGVELQQPQGAYQPNRGGDAVYSAPSGAPPGKEGDGVVR